MDGLGRDRLTLKEATIPTPRLGEVLVKVAAVALNYRDRLVIENGMGMALAFPFTPGSDLAGTVQATGPGTTRLAVGDRVISTFWPGWIDGAAHGNARMPAYRSSAEATPACSPNTWLFRKSGSCARRPRSTRRRPAPCPAPASPPGSPWSKKESCALARRC
ncbi:alcohol dehydrogenase catalytic domain-containing protein [Xanthomonas theicola]|uniref:alcohol dehydrogenase catalytic domain-containing protein n=1 Tax=Xanthomonas theicola TaxID=56464 RepID=UPI0036DAC5E6